MALDSVTNKIKQAVFSGIAVRVVAHVFNFGLGVILARILSPSDFGVFAIAMLFTGIAGALADFGLLSGLLQRRRLHEVHYCSVYIIHLIAALLLTLALLCSTPIISSVFSVVGHESEISALFYVVFLNAISGVPQVVYKKRYEHARIGYLRLISSAVAGIVAVALSILGWGMWAVVLQCITSALLFFILMAAILPWHSKLLFSWKAVAQLAQFSGAMYVSKLLDAIFSRFDIVLIAKITNIDILGAYQRAKAVSSIAADMFFLSMLDVFFPFLSSISSSGKRFNRIFLIALNVMAFVSIYISFLLPLVAVDLVVMIYGVDWIVAGEALEIISMISFSYPVSMLLTMAVSAKGRSVQFLLLEIIKKGLLVIHFGAGFLYGYEVFLWLIILRGWVAVFINIYFSARETGVAYFALLYPIVLHALIGGSAWFVSYELFEKGEPGKLLDIWSVIIVYSIVYFGLAALCRSIGLGAMWRLVRQRFLGGVC